MNSKELVATALRGRPVPRVPTGPLAVHFCATFAGHTLRAYSTDPHILADCVIGYYERFRPDAVWVSADTWVSAEAMGATVGSTHENQPLGGMGPALVQTAADIDRIAPADVGSQGRYPMMLEALSRVVSELGKEVCVVACFDQYPFSLAAALMGMNEIMLRTLDDPPFVEALMARCAEHTIGYGRALAGAGADVLSGGDSPAGLLGPELYASLALPYERQVVSALQGTEKPVSLHICGNAMPILSQMADSGADILELDHFVELKEASRRLNSRAAIWGNVDPVTILAQGTPADVEHAGREAIRAVGAAPFVLSSGCTLVTDTPAENLDALFRAAARG